MSDQKFRDDLPLYADGELDAGRMSEIEAALEQSPELRAELERWRGLRHCAKRAVMAEPVPAGLRNTVVASLRAEEVPARSSRVYRLFGGFTAVAAAIALVAFLWQPETSSAAPQVVEAKRFTQVYEKCAVRHHHCTVDIDASDIPGVHAKLVGLQQSPVLLPDLSADGFELNGVCRCFGVRDVHVIHAHYERKGDDPAIVSFFSIDRPLRLKVCEKATCCQRARDGYETAENEGVFVCKWEEAGNCYAVCGEMDPQQLQELADVVRVARWIRTVEPSFAMAW